MSILTTLFALYIWFGIGVLIIILYHIGRFYQTTAGISTHYRFFLVPMFLYIAGMLRYLTSGVNFADTISVYIVGDSAGDTLFFLGGISLALIGYYLLKLMIGDR